MTSLFAEGLPVQFPPAPACIPDPVSPCLRTLAQIAAGGRLPFISQRFARGCGAGRFVVRGYGIVGVGQSWSEAAAMWAIVARDRAGD